MSNHESVLDEMEELLISFNNSLAKIKFAFHLSSERLSRSAKKNLP